MKLRPVLYALLILLFIFPSISLSHPHVFVVNRVIFVFDKDGLAGIRLSWNFDDFFSSMIAMDYDKNHNGSFEASEISLIKKEAFDYLANSDYFTFIKIDNKPFKVKYVCDFVPKLKDGKLSYNFFVPCHVKALSNFKKVVIAVYDPSYYSAVFFGKNNPVSIEKGSRFKTDWKIAENIKETYYYDQIHPVELIFNFCFKNDNVK